VKAVRTEMKWSMVLPGITDHCDDGGDWVCNREAIWFLDIPVCWFREITSPCSSVAVNSKVFVNKIAPNGKCRQADDVCVGGSSCDLRFPAIGTVRGTREVLGCSEVPRPQG